MAAQDRLSRLTGPRQLTDWLAGEVRTG